MIAYHFVGATLRDGRPVPPDGEWLVHEGPVTMCNSVSVQRRKHLQQEPPHLNTALAHAGPPADTEAWASRLAADSVAAGEIDVNVPAAPSRWTALDVVGNAEWADENCNTEAAEMLRAYADLLAQQERQEGRQ